LFWFFLNKIQFLFESVWSYPWASTTLTYHWFPVHVHKNCNLHICVFKFSVGGGIYHANASITWHLFQICKFLEYSTWESYWYREGITIKCGSFNIS
jgi:hypothetical protein